MLKYFKYGLAGVFNNLAYTIIVILVGIFYSPQDAILMFAVDASYGLCESFLNSIIKGRFYYKEKNSKGLSLVLLGLIISLSFFLFRKDFGYTMFILTLIISLYTVYTVDMAIYENKPILNLSVIYGVGLTLNVFIVLYFNILADFKLWERLYFCYAFSGIIFDAIPNLVFLKYNPISIFKIKIFSIKWYKEELKNIYGSLIRINQPVLSSLCRMLIVGGLSALKGQEQLVALLISTEKVARVFFDARYYVLKSRTFALVDSDGKHMDVKNTFELNKALLIFYIIDMASLVFLCMSRGIYFLIPIVVFRESFAYLMPCTNFHYFIEFIQYKKQGLIVAICRTICYTVQVLCVMSVNLVFIFAYPVIDAILYYILIRSSYNIYCKRSKINKVNYTLKEVLYGKELIH